MCAKTRESKHKGATQVDKCKRLKFFTPPSRACEPASLHFEEASNTYCKNPPTVIKLFWGRKKDGFIHLLGIAGQEKVPLPLRGFQVPSQ